MERREKLAALATLLLLILDAIVGLTNLYAAGIMAVSLALVGVVIVLLATRPNVEKMKQWISSLNVLLSAAVGFAATPLVKVGVLLITDTASIPPEFVWLCFVLWMIWLGMWIALWGFILFPKYLTEMLEKRTKRKVEPETKLQEEATANTTITRDGATISTTIKGVGASIKITATKKSIKITTKIRKSDDEKTKRPA